MNILSSSGVLVPPLESFKPLKRNPTTSSSYIKLVDPGSLPILPIPTFKNSPKKTFQPQPKQLQKQAVTYVIQSETPKKKYSRRNLGWSKIAKHNTKDLYCEGWMKL